MMYCMCSFRRVTLVCPPMGPPGIVLSAETIELNVHLQWDSSTVSSLLKANWVFLCPISNCRCQGKKGKWEGPGYHNILKSASMKMGSAPVILAIASRSR